MSCYLSDNEKQLLGYLFYFLVTSLYSFYCSKRIELCNWQLNNVNSFLINNVNFCSLIIKEIKCLQAAGILLPIQESLSFKVTVRERMNKVNILSIPNVVVNHLNCPKYVRYFLKKHKDLPFLPHYLIFRPFLISCFPSVKYSHFIQFSLVTQQCPTLCDAVDCSTPGLPVHHQLPELV